ncbi:hypothetical protein, partial [Bacillus paralicheniformis]
FCQRSETIPDWNGLSRLLTKSQNGFCFGVLSSFQRDPQPLQSRKAEHRKLTFTGCDDGGVQAGRLGG